MAVHLLGKLLTKVVTPPNASPSVFFFFISVLVSVRGRSPTIYLEMRKS